MSFVCLVQNIDACFALVLLLRIFFQFCPFFYFSFLFTFLVFSERRFQSLSNAWTLTSGELHQRRTSPAENFTSGEPHQRRTSPAENLTSGEPHQRRTSPAGWSSQVHPPRTHLFFPHRKKMAVPCSGFARTYKKNTSIIIINISGFANACVAVAAVYFNLVCLNYFY